MQPHYELDITKSKLRDDSRKIVRDVERLLETTAAIAFLLRYLIGRR